MTISFNDISEGQHDARISDIEVVYNKSGEYLRFIFTVSDSKFNEHDFSTTLKVSGSKKSDFYRWITILVGREIDLLDTCSLIGKQCRISVVKMGNDLFSVHPVSPLH
ncbi:MAG: hypothetical protein GY909_00165 [Oligoflexia bacterium]|nr:hypothetical protein [Oligoflexia bacterium]